MKLYEIVMRSRIFWIILCFIGLSGCKKYLTLKPEDSYTDQQVFRSEAAIQQTLNGIYTELCDNDLYGFQLTQYALEYLGQQYVVSTLSKGLLTQLYSYDFTGAETAALFNATWTKAYQIISELNSFIKSLNAYSGATLTQEHKRLMLGEAIAIRAFIHFDLLRIFGPVYSVDPGQTSIPYYQKLTDASQPILPANEALGLVVADFRTALDSLKNDPVITKGIIISENTDFYSSYRNRRMNYYAVKGLLARALLYGGQNEEANTLAKEVLNDGEKWFNWLPYTAIISAGTNPDRIFSPEVIFGIDNRKMYDNFQAYFTTNTTTPARADEDRLEYTFEYNTNDYRYLATWIYNTQNWRTFSKFADVSDATATWRYFQPLLRKSELYYIIAETESDPDMALKYLNAVRENRGLTDLDNSADIPGEIAKEYQKEFFGEGQLFFYYKRLNFPYFPDGSDVWNDIWEPYYVVPLPQSETKLR